jgi:hypothetical protein
VATRIARTISWFATRTIPSAVSTSSSASDSAREETAAPAASRSSETPPARAESAERKPSSRFASVTVGSVPPRP